MGIGNAGILWLLVAQEQILELIHSGIGEHQGWIVFNNNRGRLDDFMALTFEEVQEFFPDSRCVIHTCSQ